MISFLQRKAHYHRFNLQNEISALLDTSSTLKKHELHAKMKADVGAVRSRRVPGVHHRSHEVERTRVRQRVQPKKYEKNVHKSGEYVATVQTCQNQSILTIMSSLKRLEAR